MQGSEKETLLGRKILFTKSIAKHKQIASYPRYDTIKKAFQFCELKGFLC